MGDTLLTNYVCDLCGVEETVAASDRSWLTLYDGVMYSIWGRKFNKYTLCPSCRKKIEKHKEVE